MSDYPFATFYDFMAGLQGMLSTEFYGEEFPKFEKILNKYGGDYCKKIVVKFVNNENEGISPQYALESIIDCYLNDGSRYADNFIRGGCLMIDYLLEKGAEFPTHLLFSGPDMDESFYEQLSSNYFQVAALLLDHYGPILNLDISLYADWESIEAADWKDVEDLEEDEENVKMAYLKYLSKYIQEKYPEDED